MGIHVIRQGEHLSGIAHQYGFTDYQTIWNHGQNADLRQQRANPHVLNPGDILYVPDMETKTLPCATDKLHKFVMKGKGLRLRLVLNDWNGDPIKNTPCTLAVENQTYQLKTDGKGMVSQTISPEARKGKLRIRDMEVDLLIGELDPAEYLSGWRARLNNLGYNAGDADDEDDLKLRSAVEQFQHDLGLKRDGACGPKTQAALLKAHGS